MLRSVRFPSETIEFGGKACVSQLLEGGGSGMVAAYLLDRQGHGVTVFEREPVLGGHIRTLNKNVRPNHSDCNEILENGVLEFPVAFRNFLALMQELEVEVEPVTIGSGVFLRDGRYILSTRSIQRNFSGLQRLYEYLRLDTVYARSAGFWVRSRFMHTEEFYNRPLSYYFSRRCIRNCWLKLLAMYSYSTPFEAIDRCPASLVIPALKDYIFVKWVRVKGGVYSYIEKILSRFNGNIHLDARISTIERCANIVRIHMAGGDSLEFDKVVFATSPDRVLKLLADPSEAEMKRFGAWQENCIETILHFDTSMYEPYGIRAYSEFDFFQGLDGWGYNAYLNQLCGIHSPPHYSLAFNLKRAIAPQKIVHIQEHSTPLYTVEAFRYRDEIVATNGEHHTYYAGAYLGDGLHEGAIVSAMRLAQLLKSG